MKRTLLLLAIFLLLGGGTAWYLNTGGGNKTTLAGADRDFAMKDMEKVQKIFIADRDGERTTLERRDGYWLYNGQYKARPTVIRPLLEAVKHVQVKYKPPHAAVPNMVKVLATEGIKVELYGAEDELLKSYYVGGATSDERGTYMIMEGAEQPYVVFLPSWEGNLSVRFKRSGDDWRDKSLFSSEMEDIQSVSIQYPKQRNQSFILERKGGDFTVRPFYGITPQANRPYREGSAEAFLAKFESVGAEDFRNNLPGRDSIRQLVPFSIITLATTGGDTSRASLFPILPENVVSQDPKSGNFVTSHNEIERYFVDLNGQDFFMAQHRVLQDILWGYSSFFKDQDLLN